MHWPPCGRRRAAPAPRWRQARVAAGPCHAPGPYRPYGHDPRRRRPPRDATAARASSGAPRRGGVVPHATRRPPGPRREPLDPPASSATRRDGLSAHADSARWSGEDRCVAAIESDPQDAGPRPRRRRTGQGFVHVGGPCWICRGERRLETSRHLTRRLGRSKQQQPRNDAFVPTLASKAGGESVGLFGAPANLLLEPPKLRLRFARDRRRTCQIVQDQVDDTACWQQDRDLGFGHPARIEYAEKSLHHRSLEPVMKPRADAREVADAEVGPQRYPDPREDLDTWVDLCCLDPGEM
jgi:hypothetical protein